MGEKLTGAPGRARAEALAAGAMFADMDMPAELAERFSAFYGAMPEGVKAPAERPGSDERTESERRCC